MRWIRLVEAIGVSCLVLCVPATPAQAPTAGTGQEIGVGNGTYEFVPSKAVDFEPVEAGPSSAFPSTTVDYPH